MKTPFTHELFDTTNSILVEVLAISVIVSSIIHMNIGCPPILQWAQGLFLTGFGFWAGSLILRRKIHQVDAARAERLDELRRWGQVIAFLLLMTSAPLAIVSFL